MDDVEKGKQLRKAHRSKTIGTIIAVIGVLFILVALAGYLLLGFTPGIGSFLIFLVGVSVHYHYRKIEKEITETGESKQLQTDQSRNKKAWIILIAILALGGLLVLSSFLQWS